jgi:hypothetical protein
VLTAIRPSPWLPASTLLSCANTWLRHRSEQYYTAFLLSASRPGTRPPALPGLEQMRGHPGVYHRELPHGFPAIDTAQPMVARRSGAGWLVVEANTSLARRLAVLSELTPHYR